MENILVDLAERLVLWSSRERPVRLLFGGQLCGRRQLGERGRGVDRGVGRGQQPVLLVGPTSRHFVGLNSRSTVRLSPHTDHSHSGHFHEPTTH